MLDIEIRQLRDDIIKQINDSQLPLEIKRLVLSEVYRSVAEASDNFINSEKQKVIEQLNDENNVHPSAIENNEEK